MSQIPALAFDEFGRPFIIIKDQSTKKRLKGIEAHKVSREGDGGGVRTGSQHLSLTLSFPHSLSSPSPSPLQSHILAARTLAGILRSSLGPKGQIAWLSTITIG